RFQVRAAAVFVHDDHVLLHRLATDAFWTLPGGRVEAGEDARAALVREMREELNEAIECEQLLYVAENFFTHLNQPNHEIGLYFQARFHPDSGLLDTSRCHAGVEGGTHLEFRWFSKEMLHGMELYPAFLCESLSLPILSFQHIVQHG